MHPMVKNSVTIVTWSMSLAGFATIMLGSYMGSWPLIMLGLALFFPSGVVAIVVAGMDGRDKE